jgi:phage antirepressor YoqD-like protein
MTSTNLTEIEIEDRTSGSGASPFDPICGYYPDGRKYWTARELMSWLGYTNWRNGEKAIDRAIQSCKNQEQDVTGNFVRTIKLSNQHNNKVSEIVDYELSRFACYLLAMNADPGKEKVAQAQGYFAVQTHKAEVAQSLDPSSLSRRDILQMAIDSEDARLLAEAKLSLAQLQIRAERPIVEFGKAILKATSNIRIGDFAKILGDVGRNNYFKELRCCGIILKSSTLPEQSMIDRGYFVATEVMQNGKLYPVSLITTKGQQYLVDRHKKYLTGISIERQMELEIDDALV